MEGRSVSILGKFAIAAMIIVPAGYGVYTYGTSSFIDEDGELSEPFFGATKQETGEISKTIGETEYVLRDGLVFEDFPSSTNSEPRPIDLYIYDFNVGILHTDASSWGPESGSEPFSRLKDDQGLLPKHFKYVRGIACDIAQEYIARAESPQYDQVPVDISLFHDRHCNGGLE